MSISVFFNSSSPLRAFNGHAQWLLQPISPLISWLIKPFIPLFVRFGVLFFFFSYIAASSPLFALFFCSSPLKISASIFSFKERQIKVVPSSACLSMWSTWRNYYSLILGGCSAKRAIHTEFYSNWHESTFKDNAFAWFYSLWDLSNSIYLFLSLLIF